MWITNANANTVAVYSSTGATAPGSPYMESSLSYPYAVAFDASGYGWIADQAALTRFSTSGNPGHLSYSSPSGTIPTGLAIDGTGNIWVTDVANNVILETNHSGNFLSGPVGFQLGQTGIPEAVAVDGSGNVWYSTYNEAAIYELVGAGSPRRHPSRLRNEKQPPRHPPLTRPSIAGSITNVSEEDRGHSMGKACSRYVPPDRICRQTLRRLQGA